MRERIQTTAVAVLAIGSFLLLAFCGSEMVAPSRVDGIWFNDAGAWTLVSASRLRG